MEVRAYSFLQGKPVTIDNVAEAVSGLELNFNTTYSTDYVRQIYASMQQDNWTDSRLSWSLLYLIKHHKYQNIPYSAWYDASPMLYGYDWYSQKRKEGYSENSIQSFRINGSIYYRLRESDRLETLFEEVKTEKPPVPQPTISDDSEIRSQAKRLLEDNLDSLDQNTARKLTNLVKHGYWTSFLLCLAEFGKEHNIEVFRNVKRQKQVYPFVNNQQKLVLREVIEKFKLFYGDKWERKMEIEFGDNWKERYGYEVHHYADR